MVRTGPNFPSEKNKKLPDEQDVNLIISIGDCAARKVNSSIVSKFDEKIKEDPSSKFAKVSDPNNLLLNSQRLRAIRCINSNPSSEPSSYLSRSSQPSFIQSEASSLMNPLDSKRQASVFSSVVSSNKP